MLGDKKQKDNKALRDTLEVPDDDECVEFAENVNILFYLKSEKFSLSALPLYLFYLHTCVSTF